MVESQTSVVLFVGLNLVILLRGFLQLFFPLIYELTKDLYTRKESPKRGWTRFYTRTGGKILFTLSSFVTKKLTFRRFFYHLLQKYEENQIYRNL